MVTRTYMYTASRLKYTAAIYRKSADLNLSGIRHYTQTPLIIIRWWQQPPGKNLSLSSRTAAWHTGTITLASNIALCSSAGGPRQN